MIRSLRARLTWWNISVLFVVLVPIGIYTYQRESRELGELQDSRLALAGRTVGALIAHGAALPVLVARPAGSHRTVVSVDAQQTDREVGYQAFDSAGTAIVVTADFADMAPPTAADLGFRTQRFKGAPWRLFTLRTRSGILVRIGERFDTRQDITRSLQIEHSLPLVIGLPLLALLIGIAVRRGLRPLEHLTEVLHARTPGNRQPVVMDGAPSELKPLIETLNLQLERLENALEREQRFNADVAHELRTPLAATMIHLESAAIEPDRAAAGAAMLSAQQSLARLARRIEQILALARLEIGAATGQREPCDLIALIKATIEELVPLIMEKDITMSFVYRDDANALMLGHEASLAAMFRNLIENALRYVALGGAVEVTLGAVEDAIQVDVIDDGPGIPADRRELVFNRFHRENNERADGYGIGLNIVRQAALLHDATVELSEPFAGTGLHVRVQLPRSEREIAGVVHRMQSPIGLKPNYHSTLSAGARRDVSSGESKDVSEPGATTHWQQGTLADGA